MLVITFLWKHVFGLWKLNNKEEKEDIRLKWACWSPTLTLKDLLMLLLFSLRLVVWCSFSVFPAVGGWALLQCLFSAARRNVWFPEVTPALQPGIQALKSSDTDPAWLSSEQSSLVVEWQKIRDLKQGHPHKVSFRVGFFHTNRNDDH